MKRFINKSERFAQLSLLAVMSILILIVLCTGNANAQSRLKWYRNYQSSVEYPQWKKNQPKFRVEQVKYAVQVSKENEKESESNQKFNRKIERIRQRIK